MKLRLDPVDVVADVLQRVYGDAVQTVLDLQAASEVVKALQQNLVMVPSWVLAAVVDAAGGHIRVEDCWRFQHNPPEMEIWVEEASRYIDIKIRRGA